MTILMISQTHCAVNTFWYPTTIFTTHHGRVSPAILKDDDLFLLGKCLVYFSQEQARKFALNCFLHSLATHISKNDIGQLCFAKSFLQFHESIFTLLCLIE